LVGHRPPASELRTPLAAASAARVLHRELKDKMEREGLAPEPGEWVVSVAFVSVDLTVLGLTPMFEAGNEGALMETLKDNIAIGLVFAVVDHEADEEKRLVVGARPFLATKQTEGWLEELFPIMHTYV
jgi:hypothetical protein